MAAPVADGPGARTAIVGQDYARLWPVPLGFACTIVDHDFVVAAVSMLTANLVKRGAM